MTALVVGVGAADRGDDGVGVAVAEAVRARIDASPGRPAAPAVCAVSSPTRLVDTWDGYDDVVVVDAVRSGHAPGQVTVLPVGEKPLGTRSGPGGSHGFGVADAVELARALDRLPARLVLVGVEAASFETGATLSPAVAAAVPVAVDAVLTALSAAATRGGGV